MKKTFVGSMLLSAFLVLSACSHKKDDKKKDRPAPETASLSTEVSQESLNKITDTWPQASQDAIKTMKDKYGLPDAVTEEMVVWNDIEPFKRGIVYKEEVNHMFPVQHSDVLQQTISYRVPLDKVSQLNKFDGSLLIDRTKGELSSRNQREEMNILAFNLADKIVRGEITVEEARRQYRRNAEELMAGGTNPLLSSLNFQTRGNTSDPDSMMQSQELQQDKSGAKKQEQQAGQGEVDVIIIDQADESQSKESGSPTPEEQQMQEESPESQESEEMKKADESLFE
ncbi:MAG: hypothetical protein ACLGHN_12665 [Bacteriovoracia bacterium]